MLDIGTIKDPLQFLKTNKVKVLTLDVETLDSKVLGLWNEPLVSYAVSFHSGPLVKLRCPTYGSIIQRLDEEPTLLDELIGLLRACEKHGIVVCGHNVSYAYKHVQSVAPWASGYDLPKIVKRASAHELEARFVPELKVFDTMDIAVVSYDHNQHDLTLPSGIKQRILGLQRIENDFNIIRPNGQEKLGPIVREVYTEYLRTRNPDKLRQILVYNCVDSIVESIVSSIFDHCISHCKLTKRIVSPKSRCPHIPQEFRIENMSEWSTLSHMGSAKELVALVD